MNFYEFLKRSKYTKKTTRLRGEYIERFDHYAILLFPEGLENELESIQKRLACYNAAQTLKTWDLSLLQEFKDRLVALKEEKSLAKAIQKAIALNKVIDVSINENAPVLMEVIASSGFFEEMVQSLQLNIDYLISAMSALKEQLELLQALHSDGGSALKIRTALTLILDENMSLLIRVIEGIYQSASSELSRCVNKNDLVLERARCQCMSDGLFCLRNQIVAWVNNYRNNKLRQQVKERIELLDRIDSVCVSITQAIGPLTQEAVQTAQLRQR